MEPRIINLLNNLARVREKLAAVKAVEDADIVNEASKEICKVYADPKIAEQITLNGRPE